MSGTVYSTQLQAGLGMIEETDSLLSIYSDGMSVSSLSKEALDTGVFATRSARSVRNLVAECFAPRYLIDKGKPARLLKKLQTKLPSDDIKQLYFIYTCRANDILADFVREVYWPYYSAGKTELQTGDAFDFVVRSNQDGKTKKLWSESTIKRVSSYLVGCCADFGLLEDGARKSARSFSSFRIRRNVALWLSHELHFQGLGDNSVVGHSDWQLFGLEELDVVDQLQAISLDGHYVVQAAGGVVSISWKYEEMEEFLNVIS